MSFHGDFLNEIQADLSHRTRWRRRFCRAVTWGKHFYGEVGEAHVGLVDFVESDETFMASHRQCEICYHMRTVATWEDSPGERRLLAALPVHGDACKCLNCRVVRIGKWVKKKSTRL